MAHNSIDFNENADASKNATNRMLLIVDPQVDFITGSLPVPDAVNAMDRLAEYVKKHGEEYEVIAVTSDRHCMMHSSFKEYGGKWPRHCVEGSVGAAIWPSLMEALYTVSDHVALVYKGQECRREEYSIFDSKDGKPAVDAYLEGSHDNNKSGKITEVDICGLAGDVCVAQTLRDLKELYPELKVRILKRFTASIDGGIRLDELTKCYGLEVLE